jgi:hypothetical protein
VISIVENQVYLHKSIGSLYGKLIYTKVGEEIIDTIDFSNFIPIDVLVLKTENQISARTIVDCDSSDSKIYDDDKPEILFFFTKH